jgi:hypothetical protein
MLQAGTSWCGIHLLVLWARFAVSQENTRSLPATVGGEDRYFWGKAPEPLTNGHLGHLQNATPIVVGVAPCRWVHPVMWGTSGS